MHKNQNDGFFVVAKLYKWIFGKTGKMRRVVMP